MAIMVTAIGVVLPLSLSYTFAKKLSEKAIKKLQIDLDKKVSNYLEIERVKKIDRYAKDLNGSDEGLKTNAIYFFNVNRTEEFTDDHFMQFYTYIKNNTDEDTLIANLLSTRKNNLADLLFTDFTQLTKDFFESTGFSYISKYPDERFKLIIKQYLTNNSYEWSRLKNSIKKLNSYNLFKEDTLKDKDYLTILKSYLSKNNIIGGLFEAFDFIKDTKKFTIKETIDNKELINLVPNAAFNMLKTTYAAKLNLVQKAEMELEEFDTSYLAEKIKTVKNE